MKVKTFAAVLALIVPVVILGLTSMTRQFDSNAQSVTRTTEQSTPVQQTPPPATKLEGFNPVAGSVLTLGYERLGPVILGAISADVRELRDAKRANVLGIGVYVYERQSQNKQSSFVDADEIPALLKAIDALLEVKANPTKFSNFEMRYTTRGELEVTAYGTTGGQINFAVQTGRTLQASKTGLSATDMMKFRTLIERASQKINEVTSGK